MGLKSKLIFVITIVIFPLIAIGQEDKPMDAVSIVFKCSKCGISKTIGFSSVNEIEDFGLDKRSPIPSDSLFVQTHNSLMRVAKVNGFRVGYDSSPHGCLCEKHYLDLKALEEDYQERIQNFCAKTPEAPSE